MYLPDNFGGDNNDNIYACIRTVKELVSESKRAESFCIEHGCEKGKAKYMALFVEEMAGNILQHGKKTEHLLTTVSLPIMVKYV